ncbi:gas vesicle protein [Cellulosimicrobium cellulans]|uniref:gas vesicle protein n=1 Tax=Cellulosimicrobium cellulans TaxID=1710 RepID=UPI0008483ADA|nr:gas vesicle protein [Cellulosimicrobium cellulans]
MSELATATVAAPPLEPTRDVRATLPDLVDALLDKGVFLDLDLAVSVAGIPLIGVSLRATLAGFETLLEHGMLVGWDEQTRARARRSGEPEQLASGTASTTGPMWFAEELAGGTTWREGTGTLDPAGGLAWTGALERRPAVRLRPDELLAVEREPGASPAGDEVVVVTGPTGAARLAVPDTERWLRALRALADEPPTHGRTDRPGGAA